MIKKIIIAIVIVLIVIFCINFLKSSSSSDSATNKTIDKITGQTKQTDTSTLKTFTAQEVVTHGNSSSCWTIINNEIYDLTSFIQNHPGGDKAILSLCGKNGTDAFTKQHGGQSKPENTLAKFVIGNLSK